MTTTRRLELAEDTFCTGIHGITGQEIDEGTLPEGTVIRDLRGPSEEYEPEGGYEGTKWRFESLSNGAWWTQETYRRPATRPAK